MIGIFCRRVLMRLSFFQSFSLTIASYLLLQLRNTKQKEQSSRNFRSKIYCCIIANMYSLPEHPVRVRTTTVSNTKIWENVYDQSHEAMNKRVFCRLSFTIVSPNEFTKSARAPRNSSCWLQGVHVFAHPRNHLGETLISSCLFAQNLDEIAPVWRTVWQATEKKFRSISGVRTMCSSYLARSTHVSCPKHNSKQ